MYTNQYHISGNFRLYLIFGCMALCKIKITENLFMHNAKFCVDTICFVKTRGTIIIKWHCFVSLAGSLINMVASQTHVLWDHS